MLPSAVLPFIWSGLLARVNVEGPSICPEPPEVAERLADLVPDAAGPPGPAARAVARIEGTLDGLRVRLLGGDGGVLGDRTLAGDHGCEELADAAAVLIASWLMSPHAPALRAPDASSEPATITATAARPPPERWDVGAAAGVASSADGLTSALQASGGVTLLPGGVGLRLSASVTGRSQTPLGEQSASWRRSSLSIGPRAVARAGWLSGELHAGAAAGWLEVEGRGFAPEDTRKSTGLGWGLTGGLRVGLSRWRWQPFLDAGLAFWPVRSVVYALPDASAALPRTQLFVTLGVCHGR